MLKTTFIVLILLVPTLNSLAQNLSIGPIIGLNYSKFSHNETSAFKPGINSGVFLNYSTKTDFGFNGSLIYSQLGADVKNSENYLRLNYLQLPVNLVYYFGEGMRKGSFRPKVFIGPYIGYLISAKTPGFTSEQTLKQMNETDFGVNLGAGFNLAIQSKTWLNVELKYGHGLSIIPILFDDNNRALSLNVGLSFPLGNFDKKTGKLKI